MSGKGSKPRPFTVDQNTFSDNWDKIFNPKVRDDDIAEEEAWQLIEDRIEREKQSLKKMKDPRSEAEKQFAAWAKDEFYDRDIDSNIDY